MNDSITETIKKYSLLQNRGRARAFGQNFLIDENILSKIVNSLNPVNQAQNIIEIGPGPCSLTKYLSRFFPQSNIICIEKDKTLKKLHDDFIKADKRPGTINFIYDDAIKIKFDTISKSKLYIISNLPYNMGTAILLHIFKYIKSIDKMIFMFQKEVAQRICADTGSSQYGRLSIISQLLCETQILFDVKNTSFYPKPKVTSTIIKLTPKPICDEFLEKIHKLEVLTNLCFQQRRKSIKTILKKKIDQNIIIDVLKNLSIPFSVRPECISPQMFLALSEKLII